MIYSKILKTLLILPLPLTLMGCLTSPYQPGPAYPQTMSKAQIEQLKIDQQIRVKQQQKIIQQNASSQTVHVHHYPQPYQVNPAAAPNHAVANPPQVGQGQYNPQVREATQVQQAKQNSLGTYVGEDMRRRDAVKEEARQLEQARQNSRQTLATDEARRQERAVEEARQIEQATQESLRTHAEETAKRQQAVNASQVAVPQPVVQQPSVVPVPEWEPNSGHLVRAGDLVMALKRSKGGIDPTHAEMAQHVQANMGVSATQTEKILEELGL